MSQHDLRGVDFFGGARGALNRRRQELHEKYPGEARDVLGMVRLGLIDRDAEVAMNALDLRLIELIDLVEANESGAALALHGLLADSLATEMTTPMMLVLLAAMHNALSRGLPADAAMKVKPPAGRPRNAQRDAAIRGYVTGERAARELFDRNSPSDAAIYKCAASIFAVSVKTIKNICAADA